MSKKPILSTHLIRALIITILYLLTFLVPHVISAATITVTNIGNSGAGTLRNAIAGASNGDTVVFNLNPHSVIALTGGEITIGKDLTIDGSTGIDLAVSGTNSNRIFQVSSGSALTISSLALVNGLSTWGGGIYNNGSLTIVSSTIAGNTASNSGGGGLGGGIYNSNAGRLIVSSSVFSGNVAALVGFAGGAIFNDGIATVWDTTFINNSTTAVVEEFSAMDR
jgi:hypothetical protein